MVAAELSQNQRYCRFYILFHFLARFLRLIACRLEAIDTGDQLDDYTEFFAREAGGTLDYSW